MNDIKQDSGDSAEPNPGYDPEPQPSGELSPSGAAMKCMQRRTPNPPLKNLIRSIHMQAAEAGVSS